MKYKECYCLFICYCLSVWSSTEWLVNYWTHVFRSVMAFVLFRKQTPNSKHLTSVSCNELPRVWFCRYTCVFTSDTMIVKHENKCVNGFMFLLHWLKHPLRVLKTASYPHTHIMSSLNITLAGWWCHQVKRRWRMFVWIQTNSCQ